MIARTDFSEPEQAGVFFYSNNETTARMGVQWVESKPSK